MKPVQELWTKNGMTHVSGAEALAGADLVLGFAAPQLLSDVVAGVSQIVSAMKDFGRPDQRDRVFADLNRGLTNTLLVAQSEIRQFADVELELGELPSVSCYAGDINQVFLNLLVNAAHAIEHRFGGVDRGLICVRSWQEHDWVFIEIADNRQGIADADRPRIFEPFFTTKPVGKGTGQGLAISRSIVADKHGGSLSFDSEVGRGTRFLIKLPVEATAGQQPSSVQRSSLGGSTSP